MRLSFWEQQAILGKPDTIVVGAGITGLSTAIYLQQLRPKRKVVVLERGFLPQGASTRNAGFACFGSVSELWGDLPVLGEEGLFRLVEKRVKGLANLESLVGPKQMDLQMKGAWELFRSEDEPLWQEAQSALPQLNKMLASIFPRSPFRFRQAPSSFAKLLGAIYTPFEGQLNPGKLMEALRRKAEMEGVRVFYGAEVQGFTPGSGKVSVALKTGQSLEASQLVLCTNAFTSQLAPVEIKPSRNQVLITQTLAQGSPIVGCYHLNRGFIYLRNVDNRLLIGGARDRFPEEDEADQFSVTESVQQYLEKTLSQLLPQLGPLEVAERWSGFLGLSPVKNVAPTQFDDRVWIAAGLGGMGVALGSLLGKETAEALCAS